MGPEATHWKDRAVKAEAEVKRLTGVLRRIHMLALEANEEYESSCRRKVDAIYGLASVGCPLHGGEG